MQRVRGHARQVRPRKTAGGYAYGIRAAGTHNRQCRPAARRGNGCNGVRRRHTSPRYRLRGLPRKDFFFLGAASVMTPLRGWSAFFFFMLTLMSCCCAAVKML